MPPKRLQYRGEPRAKLLRSATTLAEAICITLGPRSKSVLIAKEWGPLAPAPYPRAPRRPSRAGVLLGVDRETFRGLAVPAGYHVRVGRAAPSPFVELDRVRRAGDHRSLLPANTRSQLRRAHRRVGTCELESSGSLDAAHDLLGGSSRYKMSLATAFAPLAWLRVQRTRLRFAAGALV